MIDKKPLPGPQAPLALPIARFLPVRAAGRGMHPSGIPATLLASRTCQGARYSPALCAEEGLPLAACRRGVRRRVGFADAVE